jgi:3-oxoacyl-[acyl-carrier-protein] synthase-3
MTYAAITGWGKCLPPAILTNQDLMTFIDTDDEWIVSRTGMKERRVSHVSVTELAHTASLQALAAAGKTALDIDMIILGSTSFDQICPNGASGVQQLLGATNAACMDVSTACTGGMYGLSTATAMIQSGMIKSALVIGAEVLSKFMDWENRNVAVLFGDGAAAFYLEASQEESGVVKQSLGCYGDARGSLSIEGWGANWINKGMPFGQVNWDFHGQEIFKKAVAGMGKACAQVVSEAGLEKSDIDLIVPHQANLRIIEALGKRMGADKEKVFVNIHRYGNMSAATAPVALVEAIEEGKVKDGDNVLMPAFGGGLTWSAHLIKWRGGSAPKNTSDARLPPCDKTALEMVNEIRQIKNKNKFV